MAMSWNGASQQPQPYYGDYGAAGQMLMGPSGQLKPGHLGMPATMEKRMPLPVQPARISVPALVGLVLGPWFTFIVVLYVRGMWLRFNYPWLSMGLAGYFLIFVLVVGVMAFSAARDPTKQGDPRTLGLAFFLCFGAWVIAYCCGNHMFTNYTQSYYDLTNLNSYPGVDPVTMTGAQLMDAGIIDFKSDAKLDLTRSIGFKDGDVYCVAPIFMGDTKETKLDFWAIGTNCCSGHTSTDFHCGEYNMPGVHQGLRLMSDDKRSFYRLAVQEAEAAYNIQASHPVFVYWVSDPVAEVEAYKDDSDKFFMFAAFGSFAVLVVLVMKAALCFHLVMPRFA